MGAESIDLNESIKDDNNAASAFINIMETADLSMDEDVFIKDKHGNNLVLYVTYYPPMDDKISEESVVLRMIDILEKIPINNITYYFSLIKYSSKYIADKNIENKLQCNIMFHIYRNSLIDNTLSNAESLSSHKIRNFWNLIRSSYLSGTLCRIETKKHGGLLANDSGFIKFTCVLNYPCYTAHDGYMDIVFKKIKSRLEDHNFDNIRYNRFVIEYSKAKPIGTEFNIYLL